MAFELVVEDGTGRSDANSFVTLAFAQAYWEAHGENVTGYTDLQEEQALVRASQYLSVSFHWKGIKKRGRNNDAGEQALVWPRYGVHDREGAYVPDDSLPHELQEATAEAAFYELVNPGALQPAYTANDTIKMLKAGPVSITYDVSRRDAWGSRPLLLVIMDLIGQFVDMGEGSRVSGMAVRA